MLNFLGFIPHFLNQMGMFPILFLFIFIAGIYKRKKQYGKIFIVLGILFIVFVVCGALIDSRLML